MKARRYEGVKTREISFPLGGIGAGCIGLGGDGRLIDWEIFNRPNKGSRNGFTHFALKAERAGEVLDVRALMGDLQPSYQGSPAASGYVGFGFGPGRETLAGMPHFRDVVFEGAFPFARILFSDPRFPGSVELSAWNPFIPQQEDDSSLPAAFFEITLENTDTQPVDYTIAFSVTNPLKRGALRHTTVCAEGMRLLLLGSDDPDTSHPDHGSLCVGTDAVDTGFQSYWYRGNWFDSLGVFWRDISTPGRLENRTYPADADVRGDTGTLTAHMTLSPGERRAARFVLAWHFPNNENFWNPPSEEEIAALARAGDGPAEPGLAGDAAAATAVTTVGAESACNGVAESACEGAAGCCCGSDRGEPDGRPGSWRNWYATAYPDSAAVCRHALREWSRLHRQTRAFADALFSSTLPDSVLEAVSANISILKSPTCLRLEDGSFYGFEGCHCHAGCCEGSCTHVWNYAQALPFLFPRLERSMRDLDFRHNLREDGGMAFRLQLPVGRRKSAFRPCADGQFGGVLKLYRDWRISGDTEWMKSHWDAVKQNIAFAWSPENEDGWDRDRDGVLEGRQHHTLDMELFGPNAWLTGLYLGALKAAAEMADTLGDTDAAAEYRALFAKGKTWTDKHLFNGQWYIQKIDLSDRTLLERYDTGNAMVGKSTLDAYWNEEAQEVKYQIGEGSGIDQVLAQWHANLYGLGEIFKPDQVKKALETIYQHNFKRTFRDFFNPCRLYSLGDEGGVVICDWPEGARKPVVPAPYSEETMCGFEYQAAIHMIQEGMVAEGLEIVRAIRDRFDGEKRNPWNEFECGSNYARSMASYALLNALSGFSFDLPRGRIGFRPVTQALLHEQATAADGLQGQQQLQALQGEFRCFWSVAGAWGVYVQTLETASLYLAEGSLPLSELDVGREAFRRAASLVPQNHPGSATGFDGIRALVLECRSDAGTREVAVNIVEGVVQLEDGFVLQSGETLIVPLT